MEACRDNSVVWAIFSDKYGVWFSDVQHEWYEKDPDSVSNAEFVGLLDDFDTRLKNFEEIWFYHNPGRFHPLYARLLEATKLRDKVKMFSHLAQIGEEGAQMNEGPGNGIYHPNAQTDVRRGRIGRTDAARILNKLQIIKAYGPTGKINGPNCNRFGHRDAPTRHWYWDVVELVHEARKRNCAPPETIRQVEDEYLIPDAKQEQGLETDGPARAVKTSRADLEMRFRDTIIELEQKMRVRIPSSQAGRDRRTLGFLIHEAEEWKSCGLQREVLKSIHLKEARFVNEVRNAQNHPTTEQNSDEDLSRAIQSARAIIGALENR